MQQSEIHRCDRTHHYDCNTMTTDFTIRKYPRTPHIEGSRLQVGDEDLSQIRFDAIRGRHLVVEEKIDGANSDISFDSDGQLLIRKAYKAMFNQSERFRAALMSTRGVTLTHSTGEQSSYKTIITPDEFCGILMEMRDNYDKRDKQLPKRKPIVFVDMDNVLVDFESGLALQNDDVKAEYEGRLDEIPGLFSDMQPMPGAIEAVHELQRYFELYILSTAPWKNPSAWSDKVKWVTQHLDDVFHKRMVITHCKNLCKGDYLIDDRGKNGTSEFEGEWIEFGNDQFPDWNTIVEYLYRQNGLTR